MMGTKWKPHEAVEFKHVVEFSERVGRMSDDSMLLGHVWNEMQSAKGKAKTLEAERDDLKNQISDLGHKAREFSPADVLLMRSERAEAKVMELGTEVARLNAGWHEANGRALEVGLERTELKKEVSEAKGLLSDCFDGIESDSLGAMIQSAGGAFALMAEAKAKSDRR